MKKSVLVGVFLIVLVISLSCVSAMGFGEWVKKILQPPQFGPDYCAPIVCGSNKQSCWDGILATKTCSKGQTVTWYSHCTNGCKNDEECADISEDVEEGPDCTDSDGDGYCLESKDSGCDNTGICEYGWDDCDDGPATSYSDEKKMLTDSDRDGNVGEHINPGASEICNGIDDDCNGEIDESLCSEENYRCVRHFSHERIEQNLVNPNEETSYIARFSPGGVAGDADCVLSSSRFTPTGQVTSYDLVPGCFPNSEYKILGDDDVFGELDVSAFMSFASQNGMSSDDLNNPDKWKTACVFKDKCADGVDNDGNEDLVNKYKLDKNFVDGTFFMKLKDQDDPDCKGKSSPITGKKYCIDSDADGYCRPNLATSDKPHVSQFPDCDDYAGDDETQYIVNPIHTVKVDYAPGSTCQGYCDNINQEKGSGSCTLLNQELDDAEIPEYYLCTVQLKGSLPLKFIPRTISKHKIVSNESPAIDDNPSCGNYCELECDAISLSDNGLKCYNPKGILKKGLIAYLGDGKQCICNMLIEDQSGWKEGTVTITAENVHPFSPLVYPSDPIAQPCGWNFDLNCNKGGSSGWDFDSLLQGGTPFDDDLNTGVEFLETESATGPSGASQDLVCDIETVGEATFKTVGPVILIGVGMIGAHVIAPYLSPGTAQTAIVLLDTVDVSGGVWDAGHAINDVINKDWESFRYHGGGALVFGLGIVKNRLARIIMMDDMAEIERASISQQSSRPRKYFIKTHQGLPVDSMETIVVTDINSMENLRAIATTELSGEYEGKFGAKLMLWDGEARWFSSNRNGAHHIDIWLKMLEEKGLISIPEAGFDNPGEVFIDLFKKYGDDALGFQIQVEFISDDTARVTGQLDSGFIWLQLGRVEGIPRTKISLKNWKRGMEYFSSSFPGIVFEPNFPSEVLNPLNAPLVNEKELANMEPLYYETIESLNKKNIDWRSVFRH